MIDLWIQPSHCVILVYSVDSKNTFTELQEIYERIKKFFALVFFVMHGWLSIVCILGVKNAVKPKE